ncbi:pilus assembly protein [Nocardioides sp. CER19]|uniref:TadE family protein n=1 Tax=Nocardioides sp. CER19 TaxID=3038538 RepID=UPI002447A2E2|nr:pilus assembly protein [Nocardioides sp. CER19]MDH2416890.1 pilus assembly protein [Nocardioides sp. CER19]
MRSHAGSRARGVVAAGAVVLNTALVAPLLVIIVLGIAETAFLMKDNVALSSLVRDGGHAAASSAALRDGDSPALGTVTAAAIARAESSLSKAEITELWIYKADAGGFPAGNPANDHFRRCETECMAYTWDADRQTLDYVGGQWDADDIDVCSDDLGVYMKANHSILTGVFSQGIGISKHETFHVTSASGSCQMVTS